MKKKTSVKKKEAENDLRLQRIREQHDKQRVKTKRVRTQQYRRRESQRLRTMNIIDEIDLPLGSRAKIISESVSLGGRKRT